MMTEFLNLVDVVNESLLDNLQIMPRLSPVHLIFMHREWLFNGCSFHGPQRHAHLFSHLFFQVQFSLETVFVNHLTNVRFQKKNWYSDMQC